MNIARLIKVLGQIKYDLKTFSHKRYAITVTEGVLSRLTTHHSGIWFYAYEKDNTYMKVYKRLYGEALELK